MRVFIIDFRKKSGSPLIKVNFLMKSASITRLNGYPMREKCFISSIITCARRRNITKIVPENVIIDVIGLSNLVDSEKEREITSELMCNTCRMR